MIKFEAQFKCATTQDAIYALQEIMKQLEEGYSCGYLNGAEGSWSCSGEDDEEDERLIYVIWDVSDSEFETFTDECVPHRVYVPMSIDEDDIADYLSDKYGYCVESFEILEN